jgi:hypothetical protein
VMGVNLTEAVNYIPVRTDRNPASLRLEGKLRFKLRLTHAPFDGLVKILA